MRGRCDRGKGHAKTKTPAVRSGQTNVLLSQSWNPSQYPLHDANNPSTAESSEETRSFERAISFVIVFGMVIFLLLFSHCREV
ncbi:hypothetical protein AB6A40_005990 [Gnathostoma spinigerum]|uniref:Uncharacterized protein n=1 Tax=Gnathostoma spinigerum TaxID=75299 RepID=A0ABD6EHS3_9BILA